MMIAIMAVYITLLFALVWIGLIRFNTFWKVSPLIVLLLLNLGLFIPMGWGAPQGSALVFRNAVSIVPDVAGEVTEVPVTANMPLKAGDILFRIDPTPYDAQVKTIAAQLKLSDTRLSQMTQLLRARRRTRLRRRAAAIRSRSAQGPAPGRAVESRQDGGARARRRLRHQPRAAQGRAGGQPAAVAGDGVHRYLGYPHGRRDQPDQCALHRARPGSRDHLQVRARRVFAGKVESILQAVATRAGADFGHGRGPEGDRARRRSWCASGSTTTISREDCRPAPPATAAIFTDHVKAATSSARCCCGSWRS